MDTQKRIEILQQYSSEEYLQQFGENKSSFSLPDKNKQELLEALWSEMQEKDKKVSGGITFNKLSIQIFCKQALTRLLSETLQERTPEDFEQVKEVFMREQIDHIQQWIHSWYIQENSEILEHTQEHKLSYRSGSFEEKWKASFGFEKNFTPRSHIPEKIKLINQEYLPLNPEKLQNHPELLDFILHGNIKKGYSFTETQTLLYTMMKNPENFKKKLLSYESLVIPTNWGYSEEISERIVAYPGVGKEETSYLITENTPQKYEERHLRKYLGNSIRFTPFLEKESASKYLWQQLLFGVNMQLERVKTFYEDFRLKDSFPVNEDTDELLHYTYQYFSHHRSKADQEISLACAHALEKKNAANRKQIITGLLQRLPEMIQQIEQKKIKMEEQFAAFRDNTLF